MARANPPAIPVIDFRRLSMTLEWQPLAGTWTPCAVPPALVHGVALIRASPPNFCVFGREGRLHLQAGSAHFALSENSPRLTYTRELASIGLRTRFAVESSTGGVLFSHGFWTGQGDSFFGWLATRAADPEWRSANGRRWSDGVEVSVLRGI